MQTGKHPKDDGVYAYVGIPSNVWGRWWCAGCRPLPSRSPIRYDYPPAASNTIEAHKSPTDLVRLLSKGGWIQFDEDEV